MKPQPLLYVSWARKSPDPREFINTDIFIRKNGMPLQQITMNTTILVKATDAFFDKVTLTKMARITSLAMISAIRPVHIPFDGDVVFFVSTGDKNQDAMRTALNSIDAAETAIRRAVRQQTASV